MIHPRAIWAIARKDALDILLNRSTLFALLMPILLTVLFLVITFVVGGVTSGSNTTVLIYDPGQSGIAQTVSSAFPHTEITEANTPAEVIAAFGPDGARKKATYDVGVVVPAGFEQALQASAHPEIQLFLNGDSIGQGQTSVLQAVIATYARTVTDPEPPISLVTATINPPTPGVNFGQLIGGLYAVASLLISFQVGLTLIPALLIEEKEKKTLRMLMVAPVSYGDVILGKLLVILVYQLLLSVTILALFLGFADTAPTADLALLGLYIVIGSCFSLALGLLFGSIFQTTSGANAVATISTFLFILPAVLVPLATLFGANNAILQLCKVLPTYYLADGVYNALLNQGSFNSQLLNVAVILGSTLILGLLATTLLRRQAAVAVAI